jgi:hypothetical protein
MHTHGGDQVSNPEIRTAQYRRLNQYVGSSPFSVHDVALRDARQMFERQGIDMRTVETLGVSIKMGYTHDDRYNRTATRWHVSVKITYRAEDS